ETAAAFGAVHPLSRREVARVAAARRRNVERLADSDRGWADDPGDGFRRAADRHYAAGVVVPRQPGDLRCGGGTARRCHRTRRTAVTCATALVAVRGEASF